MHSEAYTSLSGMLGTLRLQIWPPLVELKWGRTIVEEALFPGSEYSMSCRAQENRQNGENLIWSLLSCCLQCIWGLIEYITKFATIRAAITGEAFFEAGRNVTDLLMRNFLKAYGRMAFGSSLQLQQDSSFLSLKTDDRVILQGELSVSSSGHSLLSWGKQPIQLH